MLNLTISSFKSYNSCLLKERTDSHSNFVESERRKENKDSAVTVSYMGAFNVLSPL